LIAHLFFYAVIVSRATVYSGDTQSALNYGYRWLSMSNSILRWDYNIQMWRWYRLSDLIGINTILLLMRYASDIIFITNID